MRIINKRLNDANKIIFLDFEATQLTQEIIAIGAVKAELDAKKNIKSFDKGIRLYIYTENSIGGLVENMTGISKELLNSKGMAFEKAIEKLGNYIGGDFNFTTFMTYGNYDMRMLHHTAELNECDNNPIVRLILEKNIDFANVLSQYVRSEKNEQLSLTNALKVYNVGPTGKHHDPRNDAIDLLKLYQAFITHKSITRNEYLKVCCKNPHLQEPIRQLVLKVANEGQATLDDFLAMIDNDIK